MKRAMRRVLLFALLLSVAAGPAAADDHTSIVLWNVGGQVGMTLGSAVIQHKIHGWRDVWRCLTAGSVSGLGIYEAKSLVGRNHPGQGWILANVAGSISENAAAGRHPLGQIGYTIGPMRVRVSIPRLDRHTRSWMAADVSVFQTVALLDTISNNGRPRFRDGLIAFERPLRPDDAHLAETAGVFPSVFVDERIVWLHEFTHAVQSLQIEIPEPPSPWRRMRFDQRPAAAKRVFVLEQVKIGMFNFGNALYVASRPYEKQWPEIEAFRLTEPSASWR
jgi:hypothetical protein